MRRVLLAGIIVCSPHLTAQSRPDMSGTWTASTETPSDVPAAPSAILGARFGVQQSGDTVTMLRLSRDVTVAATFKTDGSPTTYRMPRRLCEGDIEYTETLAWEGSALALTATRVVPPGGAPQTLQIKRRIRMTSPDTLVVEGTLVQAGTSRQVGTVYTRATAPLPPPPPAPAVTRAAATIAQVAWIAGTWSGLNGATNPVTVEERWTPSASGGMIGVGRTLRGTSLVSFEFLCMAERDGGLVYIAMPDARSTPTFFTATAVTTDRVTFENPSHDFPKSITYARRADGALETTIAGPGGQRAQSFVLTKQ